MGVTTWLDNWLIELMGVHTTEPDNCCLSLCQSNKNITHSHNMMGLTANPLAVCRSLCVDWLTAVRAYVWLDDWLLTAVGTYIYLTDCLLTAMADCALLLMW